MKKTSLLSLVCLVTILLLGYWSSSPILSKEASSMAVPSSFSPIEDEDIEYFVSSVIDYLGDQEDWLDALENLTPDETEKLYVKVEDTLAQWLEEAQKSRKTFPSQEAKDRWIVHQIEKLKSMVLASPRAFLQNTSPPPPSQ